MYMKSIYYNYFFYINTFGVELYFVCLVFILNKRFFIAQSLGIGSNHLVVDNLLPYLWTTTVIYITTDITILFQLNVRLIFTNIRINNNKIVKIKLQSKCYSHFTNLFVREYSATPIVTNNSQ